MKTETQKTYTVPQYGARIDLAARESGDDWTTVGSVTVLGPSSCGTRGRIGVLHSNGTIALVHHISDVMEGAIGWMN